MDKYTIFLKTQNNEIDKIMEIKSKGLLNIMLKEIYKIYAKNNIIIVKSRTTKKAYNVIDFYNKYQNKIV